MARHAFDLATGNEFYVDRTSLIDNALQNLSPV